MDASRNRRLFDFAALGHPAWWAALALLVFNDRVLKGGGLAPGWLSGKLSDFAFLLVAPVLASALLPVKLPGRRSIAVGAVSGLFVAAKLSPAVVLRWSPRWHASASAGGSGPNPTESPRSVGPAAHRPLAARPAAGGAGARAVRARTCRRDPGRGRLSRHQRTTAVPAPTLLAERRSDGVQREGHLGAAGGSLSASRGSPRISGISNRRFDARRAVRAGRPGGIVDARRSRRSP